MQMAGVLWSEERFTGRSLVCSIVLSFSTVNLHAGATARSFLRLNAVPDEGFAFEVQGSQEIFGLNQYALCRLSLRLDHSIFVLCGFARY